jgi:hypothetical protein
VTNITVFDRFWEWGAKKSLPETLSGQNFAARANGATVNSGDYSSFSRDQYYCF